MEEQVIAKIRELGGKVVKGAIRIDGISEEDVQRVLTGLAMTGRLNSDGTRVWLAA